MKIPSWGNKAVLWENYQFSLKLWNESTSTREPQLTLVQLQDVIRKQRTDKDRAALLQQMVEREQAMQKPDVIDKCINFLDRAYSRTLFKKGQYAHKLRQELQQDPEDHYCEKFITTSWA